MKTFVPRTPDEEPPAAEEKALAFYILLTAAEKGLLAYRKGDPDRPEQECPSLFSKTTQKLEGAIYRPLHGAVPSTPPPVESRFLLHSRE